MAATRTTVGLDFGTYSIKAVWLESKAGVATVSRTEELQIPPETQDPVRFIQPWLDKHGLRKTLSSAAIPGTQTVFQPVVLPADDPRTEDEAAAAEVASFAEMAGERMQYGVATVPGDGGTRILQLALVRPGVVDSGLRGAAAFSLRLCDLVPTPVAAFNGAFAGGESAAPALYLSIGHQTTDVVVGSANGILFARSFAIGGKAFSDAIARGRGVSDLQAERLKKSEAGLASGAPHADILRPVATMWSSQVRSALSVYRGQFPGSAMQPKSIVLLGGGARLSGLAEFAAEALALPLADTAGLEKPPVPPAFATAYGLALSGAGFARCPISLFPEDLRNELVFREKKPYWIAAGVFAALILGTFIVIAVRGIARERATVEVETQRIRKLAAIDAAIERMRAETATLRATAVPVRRLLEAGPQTRELVKLLAGSIDPNDWITMVSDRELYNQSEMPVLPEEEKGKNAKTPTRPRPVTPLRITSHSGSGGGGAKSPAKPAAKPAKGNGKQEKDATSQETLPDADPTFSTFIVEGYTPQTDFSTVKLLIDKLIESPLVRRADLLSAEYVLPAMPLGDAAPSEALVGKFRRFVLQIEVNPLPVPEGDPRHE